uniref:Cytochrome P450 n=1 Tax=Kalanchoe fedtschenkoi TaxID=63787 RepID=A0A7N0T5K8_KALFE
MEFANLFQNWLVSSVIGTSPFPLLLLLCGSSLAFLLVSSVRRRQPGGSSSPPPSPPRLPIIGNLHQMSSRPYHAMHELSQKHGPLIRVHIGPRPLYVASSAELATEITKILDADSPGRDTKQASHAVFSGNRDVIFTPYDRYWRDARKLFNDELLSQKRVQSLHRIRDEQVSKLVQKIRLITSSSASDLDKKVAVDLSRMFLSLATSMDVKAVLGREYERGEDESVALGELIRKANELITEACIGEYFPRLSWLDTLTGHTRKVKNTCAPLHEFLDKVIDEHESGPVRDAQDFIYRLQKHDMGLTRADIKSLLLDVFLGGTDTSAGTMEWTMAELVKNPAAMKKVQEEIRRVVGDKPKIDESDVSQMEYLQCVIKEALRLHGPSAMSRKTSSDTRLSGGFEIPAGSSIVINLWAVNRDPTLWERPLEFVPERFVGSGHGYKGLDGKYFPFGMGKRICPGVRFAVSKVELVIANLLCWFDWELPGGMAPEDLDMRDTFAIVARKESPLCLVPRPVKAV